jgi:hypothetical protein
MGKPTYYLDGNLSGIVQLEREDSDGTLVWFLLQIVCSPSRSTFRGVPCPWMILEDQERQQHPPEWLAKA